MTPLTHVRSEQRFVLSMPPSSNNMFVNVPKRGRVQSKAYVAWIKEAGWLLQSQHPREFKVPVAIAIEVNLSASPRSDAANREKAVTDLLVKHRVIPDDSNRWVREISIKCVDVGARAP